MVAGSLGRSGLRTRRSTVRLLFSEWTFKTWARHLHDTHNFKGDPPPRAEKKKKIAAVLAPETPWGETLD